MRPVLHGDVVVAARALLGLPQAARARHVTLMLAQATAADIYRKRMRRAHPLWGNGSLMAVAMSQPLAPEPFLDDPDYCQCLALVFEALIDWRCGNAALNRVRNPHKLAPSDQAPGVLAQ